MSAISDATRPITDPMDRSIPPVMITNATPMPMMAYRLDHLSRFWRLYALRKFSLLNAVKPKIKMNKPRIPSMFLFMMIGSGGGLVSGGQLHYGFFAELIASEFACDGALVHDQRPVGDAENFLHFTGDK